MKIGIDLDDVLLAFNKGFCEYNRANYGTKVTYDDIFSYDLEKVWGCEVKEVIRRVLDFYMTDEHKNAETVPGAISGIARLAGKHELYLITSKPDYLREMTDAWLETHFSGKFTGVILTNHFAGDPSRKKKKSDVCKELGIELFIDDAPKYVRDVSQAGVPVLLLDAPWNRDIEIPEGVRRVKSWDEIARIFS